MQAVVDVFLDLFLTLVDPRAMGGKETLWLRIEEAVQGMHVFGQVARFGGNDRRTDSQDIVSCKKPFFLFQHEADVIRCVTGCVYGAKSGPLGFNDIAIFNFVDLEFIGSIEGFVSHFGDLAGAKPFKDPSNSADVISVPVGQYDLLQGLASRCLHGALQDREEFRAAIPGIQQDLLGSRSHEVGVGAGAREGAGILAQGRDCLLYTSPSPRDATLSRMPSSA